MSKWISVKDDLPEANAYVLATNGKIIEKVRFNGIRTRLDNFKFFQGWYIIEEINVRMNHE